MKAPNDEQIQKFMSIIAKEMTNYLEKGRTLGQLSLALNVPKSSLCRYMQKDSMVLPQSETAFILLKLTRSVADAAMLMKDVYPRWWQAIGKELVANRSEDIKNPDSSMQINQFDFDPISAKIFYMAHLESGVSNEWILSQFGDLGAAARDELIANGLLVSKANKFVTPSKKGLINLQTCVSLLSSFANSFPYEKVGKEVVFFQNIEAYTESFFKEMVDLAFNTNAIAQSIKARNDASTEPKQKLLTLNYLSFWENANQGCV